MVTQPQSWAQLLEQQRVEAARMRQRIEAEYESRRDDLRSQYQFAETEQEKAQLAFLMAELETATERGYQAITSGYANAVSNIQELGSRAGADASAESQAVQNLFMSGAQTLGADAGGAVTESGLARGLMGNVMQPAADFEGLMRADAAREAALTQRLGGVVSRDMTDAERRMGVQEASQQADLQRASMTSGAQTRADQQAAVAARIAADRRNFTDNLRQLQATYGTLGASADQAGLQSFGTQAELQQAEQLFLANLSTQERIAAANRAAQQAALQAGWDREDASRPSWATDEYLGRQQAWNLLPDSQKTYDRYTQYFGGLVPGVALPTPKAVSPVSPSAPRPAPTPSAPGGSLTTPGWGSFGISPTAPLNPTPRAPGLNPYGPPPEGFIGSGKWDPNRPTLKLPERNF